MSHPSASAGFVFSETLYWDQLPSLSLESQRDDAPARSWRRGFPYSNRSLPLGYPVLSTRPSILSQGFGAVH